MSPEVRSAVIVATGEELVTGRCVDTNSSWLQARLRRLGVRVLASVQVGDHPDALRDVLAQWGSRAELMVVTGGLGPTEDDRTRQALAEARGATLATCSEAERSIREFFEARGWEASPSNLRQAQLPVGAAGIPNDFGTAPGIWWEHEDGLWVALPGVPAEMRAIWEARVETLLQPYCRGPGFLERELVITGVPESVVGERIATWMRPGDPAEVAITASIGFCRITLSAVGDDIGRARLEEVEAAIRGRFVGAEVLHGSDVAAAVVARMTRTGQTLAVAESCTGGLLAGELTRIPGSSAVLLEGCVTYSNEAKQRTVGVSALSLEQFGAVSREVAIEMSLGVRARASSTRGVGITGVAGPGGGTEEKPVGLVHVALASEAGVEHHRLLLGGDREQIRRRTVAFVLHRLWEALHRSA